MSIPLRLFLFLLAASWVVASAAHAQPEYSCDPAACTLPDCLCASTQPPGGLALFEVPQFVLVTFDDCIQTNNEADIRPMLAGVRNPNGAPINVTYFLSLEGCARDDTTEAAVVLDRISAGDEIAVHTVTHSTSDTTSFSTWRREIAGVLTYLDRLGVPREQRGFRAPFVATNAALFDVLETLGILYDSSIYDSPFFSPVSNGVDKFTWPYTLDYGPAQNCGTWATFNNCTDDPKPGLWSIPVYYHVDVRSNGEHRSDYFGTFDVGNPTFSFSQKFTGDVLYQVLVDNFIVRHRGNRAPHGVYLHAPTFQTAEYREPYNRALRYMASQRDTWFVTGETLIRWMRDPVPASQMSAWISGNFTSADDPNRISDLRLTPSITTGLVRVDGSIPPGSVAEVYDAMGRRAFSFSIASGDRINLSALASGLYFVRIGETVRGVTLRK